MAIYLYAYCYTSFMLETELCDHTSKADDTLFHDLQNSSDVL